MEVGGIVNTHSAKKRKKSKSNKGKGECMVYVDRSETSAKDFTSSMDVEGKKRKKLARMQKEKIVESNVAAEPEHDAKSQEEMVSVNRNLDKKKKRRKREKGDSAEVENAFPTEFKENDSSKTGGKKSKKSSEKKKVKESQGEPEQQIPEKSSKIVNGKSKKEKRIERKSLKQSQEGTELVEDQDGPSQEEVYHISSGDEDSSKGMKKWLMEYHQSRPGLKILQQRIDDFTVAHEAKLEQERKEREALVAEDGWTVVTHHKGRKKTTDFDSGTVVGSVSEAALKDQLAKKKPKEVGLDFYRFQKREAQRNEIMMLQSKFEQDKKRIQQLRAARKFRPY